MRTFYESSIIIDGPTTRNPLRDPFFSHPPAMHTLYARQRDLTFGDNIYQYTFHYHPGAIIFVQENLTSLTYGPITVVARNRLRSVAAVLDAGDYILVYAASAARAASVPGTRDRMRNSFANRADAIFKWFSNQADRVYVLIQ